MHTLQLNKSISSYMIQRNSAAYAEDINKKVYNSKILRTTRVEKLNILRYTHPMEF